MRGCTPYNDAPAKKVPEVGPNTPVECVNNHSWCLAATPNLRQRVKQDRQKEAMDFPQTIEDVCYL
jgi:hypothetical protein